MTEIVAPAGSFENAIYAFNAGADAVYFGLSNFSARKYAINFDYNQYRKLIHFAKINNKKVYLTLNTIIKEDETDELIKTLKFLQFFPPDALIIQDFGIISLIRFFLPDISIHASTQTGTFSKYSLNLLKELKIKRIILPRETTNKKIEDIKKNFDYIEVEVFIHGALCYSFSGFCLASGLLLGRSGNKGECAQICRNNFTFESNSKLLNLSLTPFSCNDLFLREKIIDLLKIGIDSFKIEGRMKSPSYTYSTVKYYKNIMNNYYQNSQTNGLKQVPIDYKTYKDILLSFSRMPTFGYLFNNNGEKLINPLYPSHLGISLGKIIDFNKNYILTRLDKDLSKKDGVMIIFKYENNIKSFPFSVSKLMINDKEVIKANEGQNVKIFSDSLKDFWYSISNSFTKKELIEHSTGKDDIFNKFDVETINNISFITLRKISDRNLDKKKINENIYDKERYKIELNLKSKIIKEQIDKDVNKNISNENHSYEVSLSFSYQIINKKYCENINFTSYERIGKDSYFDIFILDIKKLRDEDIFEISVKFDDEFKSTFDKIFVPPSISKKIINQIKDSIKKNLINYLEFNNKEKELEQSPIIFTRQKLPTFTFKDEIDKKKISLNSNKEKLLSKIKDYLIKEQFFKRKIISPINEISGMVDRQILPFITFDNLEQVQIEKNSSIIKIENIAFLPLNPIIENIDKYIEKIENMIKNNNNFYFILGINANWHFYFYEKYLLNEKVFFFFDFYIYIANNFSYLYYSNFEKVLFGFYWIEFQDEIFKLFNKNNLVKSTFDKFPLFKIDNFSFPLFISRGCLQKNIFNNSNCQLNCTKNYSYKLKNQKNSFNYIIHDCLSYLFRID